MPAAEVVPWQRWVASRDGVGEMPVWDDRSGRLYWSDVVAPALRRSDGVAGSWESWPMPSDVATFALTDDGSVVVVLVDGIHEMRPDGRLDLVVDAPYDRDLHRFNDGRCDARGRLWIGSSRVSGSAAARGSARFWRLDDRGLVPQMSGFSLANGTAFSPGGDVMYAADSAARCVYAFDYDLDSGTPSGRRIFAEVEGKALPDGAAIDDLGGYWVAMYGGGVILRFDPTGRLDRVVSAPVSHPTMVAFGGPAGDLMFVTSARAFASAEVLAAEPTAGDVHVADVGARGAPEPRFAHLDVLRRQST